jgi:putative ATP-binding cassette transporter
MKMFHSLIHTAPVKVFISLMLSVLAGIGYTLLIPLILSSFEQGSGLPSVAHQNITFLGFEVSQYRFAALFAVACLLVLFSRTVSQLVLSRVAIDTSSSLRQKYYDRILKAPLRQLETVGSARLIASITTDVKAIVQGAILLPDLLISAVTLIGMMSFLLYLNTDVFLFICGAILFGVVTFFIPIALSSHFFRGARDKLDQLHEGIRANIYGVKELKLSKSKRESFLRDSLHSLEKDVRGINKTGTTILRVASNYGDMISFFVIGFVAFIFVNSHAVTQQELLAVVMVLLYITGPVSVVLNALPETINANISLVKVEKLFGDLAGEDISDQLYPLAPWNRLIFSNVTFHYEHEFGETFNVGPLNLEFCKGEITFIVGGNGSGKSTLAKLITSHYLPDSGQIKLDTEVVDRKLVNSYRNEVSAIYSDYYLFEKLFGVEDQLDHDLVHSYLQRLQMDHKVKLLDGCLTTLSLSDGQRKRLALLIAFLEDKSLYLFDEWAADQDPEFKQVFYFDILPYLKSLGKAVVCISHDDRYFDVADKVITMENGKVLHIQRMDQARVTNDRNSALMDVKQATGS